MEVIFFILLALILFGSFFFFFFMFIMSVLDDIWIAIFHKPLYIHLYLKPKKIAAEEAFFLRQNIPFYQKLSDKHKVYFHHRLASFKEKYEFIPREDFQIDREMQTLVAGTYVMLTFGMRRYLIDTFDKIIIYPEEYYSSHTEQYHKGEFNPRMKAVVFSWKDFIAGYETDNDNLNLGIHEFSHVVHHHSLRSNDGSALAFRKHYQRLHKEVNHPPNKQRLISSEYFRIYGFTNQFEFISVIIEHYFETPDEFKIHFPELFDHVSKMLNHKH